MGKVSVKEGKSRYQLQREELSLTREEASEIIGTITPDRLERIENGKVAIQPQDALDMSRAYKAPHLCNFYCAHDCPIGREYVPEIKVESLSQIVLGMVASLNSAHKQQERLIEIAADGVIANDEVMEFVRIREELERISVAVESLQLWTEQMAASGKIDMRAYNGPNG